MESIRQWSKTISNVQYLFLLLCLSCGFLPHYNRFLFAQAILIPFFLIIVGAQDWDIWGTLMSGSQPKHFPFRLLASLETHLLLLFDRVWGWGDGI